MVGQHRPKPGTGYFLSLHREALHRSLGVRSQRCFDLSFFDVQNVTCHRSGSKRNTCLSHTVRTRVHAKQECFCPKYAPFVDELLVVIPCVIQRICDVSNGWMFENSRYTPIAIFREASCCILQLVLNGFYHGSSTPVYSKKRPLRF